MLVGIYNIKPKENVYLAKYLLNKHFVLNTDDYFDFFKNKQLENQFEWDKALKSLIDLCLERRHYGKDTVTYDVVHLKQHYGDKKYYFVYDPDKEFTNPEKINQVTYNEQMDNIWHDILPVITKMAEAYPNIKTEPVFDYTVDTETNGVKVKLKELKFTIKD